MSKLLVVVPSGGLVTNPEQRVSYRFMLDAQLDPEQYPDVYGNPYGFIMRTPKGPDHINMFKAARGEGGVGDDGVALWSVVVGTSSGIVHQGHIEVTGKLASIMRGLPDCTVLVPPADLSGVSIACEELGIDLTVHKHDGELRLAG